MWFVGNQSAKTNRTNLLNLRCLIACRLHTVGSPTIELFVALYFRLIDNVIVSRVSH